MRRKAAPRGDAGGFAGDAGMGYRWAMADSDEMQRILIEALDEPALIVEGLTVSMANRAALTLFGDGIEGRDVRLAIRQPDLLELILSGRPGDRDVSSLGEFGRAWRAFVRSLALGSSLIRLVDRAEQMAAEKMRVDFVANASHELRTPLAAVLGYAETLADDPKLPDETVGNFGATIRDEARRMLRIVEDLMSLSRIEAERFRSPEADVDLSGVIEESVGNCAGQRDSRKCEITIKAAESLPVIRKDAFLRFCYDEDLKGFEGLSYLRITKAYGNAVIHPLVVRRYYTTHADRLSSRANLRRRSASLAKGYMRLLDEHRIIMGFRARVRVYARWAYHTMRACLLR